MLRSFLPNPPCNAGNTLDESDSLKIGNVYELSNLLGLYMWNKILLLSISNPKPELFALVIIFPITPELMFNGHYFFLN